MLNRTALAGAAALALTLAGAGSASAYDRWSTIYTWHGRYHQHVTGQCSGGTCTRDSRTVGPWGGVTTRDGSCTKVGTGQFNCAETTTGPWGHSVSHSGTITVDR